MCGFGNCQDGVEIVGVARAAANAAISHSRTSRDSTSSSTWVVPLPVMAHGGGRERKVDRSHTNVPSPTRLSIAFGMNAFAFFPLAPEN